MLCGCTSRLQQLFVNAELERAAPASQPSPDMDLGNSRSLDDLCITMPHHRMSAITPCDCQNFSNHGLGDVQQQQCGPAKQPSPTNETWADHQRVNQHRSIQQSGGCKAGARGQREQRDADHHDSHQ
eukprot:TRINITY_DN112765_c0_g1_i1.p1 TRINITY_DN112765_c0_g1~~TRINITY_DN112765_c0_g1_i1.p1  ORF type:complete len:127 (-),score=15.26 TRINITY_DN112765_c0_g1_i1:32-412(-)